MTPPVSPSLVLDPATLTMLRSIEIPGEPSLLAELIAAFHQEAPLLLERLEGAARAGQAPAVRQAAHALKGAAANLGAFRLRDACHACELAGAQGDLTDGASLVERVRAEYAEASAALETV